MNAVPTERTRVPGRRWRIAWLLGFGVLVNYFDRVNLSVSHDSLIAAFGISNIAFGYLSSAYNWTYAAIQLPIGVLLDKLGVKRVGRAGICLWSAASFCAALTPSMGGLFGARLLLGVGEAPTFPANAKAVGLWFPPQERSLATAMFDAAAKFASAIGVPVIGFALLYAGWRWSFALTGAISLAYLLYFWKVYKDPGDDAELSDCERAYIAADGGKEAGPRGLDEGKTPLLKLVAERKVLGLAIGTGACNYVFYLLLTWLPSYLSYALHVDLMHSFLYTSVPWLVASAMDIAVGGWLVDFLVQRGWNASTVRRVILIGGTTFGLGLLGAAHAHTPLRALLWISVSIGGLAAAAPVGWSLPSLIAQKNDVGKVGGIVNFSNQISGIGAPIVTGYLVTAFGTYVWAFGVAAAYLVLGIGAYIFLLGRIDRMPLRAASV
ncbi:MAG: MFS transporter [Rhodoferax sp.]|nr:MFS transporter [Rhodoferax sp.]